MYKCYYPLTHTSLAFDDVEIDLCDDQQERFIAKLVNPARPPALDRRSLAGRLRASGSHVFMAMVLRGS